MASLHSVKQHLRPRLVKRQPLASLHNLASAKPLQLVVVDQRLASLHSQLKTPDSGSRQQWAVAPLLLANHPLQGKAALLARHHKWDKSLLSDSRHLVKRLNQHSVKHQSQHLVRLALPGNHKTTPVHSVQRQPNPAASLKLHNSHLQALDSLQHLVQLQANPVPLPQQQADRLSSSQALLQLDQTTLLSNKRTRSVLLLSLLLANHHNPPHSKIHSAQHQSPPSARQRNPQTTPSANPHNPPHQPTPSANHQLLNNNNHSKLKLQQQGQTPPPPPAPTPQPTSPLPTTSPPPSKTSA